MRIISQDGTIDLPYDRVVLKTVENELIAFYGSERFPLAKYSDRQKVHSVMKAIRACNPDVIVYVDLSSKVYAEENIL